MLRVVQSTSAGQARRYYTDGLEHGDYYLDGSERPGRWGGEGSAVLGLQGTVDRNSFNRLCDNQRPDGGQLTARTKANRRVGYDMNFHAPKGVSVLHAFTHDDRLLEAVVDAANDAMRRMETEAKTRVRAGNSNTDRVTGNLLWAAFPHLTTRPIDGVPDPHLHVHFYVFNATFDATEDKWKAVEFGDLKRGAPLFEAHFHASLMRRVAELGYPTKDNGKRWDIDGLPPGVLEKFSRRTAEIEAVASKKGIVDAQAKAALGAKTRRSKNTSIPFPDVQSRWRSCVSEGERSAILSLSSDGTLATPSPKQAVDRALENCFERLSVTTERQVMAAAVRFGEGRVDEAALRTELDTRDLVRRDSKRGDTFVSLPTVLAEERRVLDLARIGRAACEALAPNVKSALSEALDRRLVEHALNSRDRVAVLRLPAAVDAAAILKEVASELEARGTRLFLVSAAPEAGSLGPPLPLDRLLSEPEPGVIRGGVLWVENSNRIGAKDAAAVLDLASKNNARVVLAGDVHRYSPTGRGDVMQLLERLAGLRSPSTSSRQAPAHDQREARSAAAIGDTASALRALDRSGCIRVTSAEDGYLDVASAFLDGARLGERSLVLATTKGEADAATRDIRQALRDAGILKRRALAVDSLEQACGTKEERSKADFYSSGQVVQFLQHVKGFKAGERYTVVGHDPFGNVLARKGLFLEALPLSKPHAFATFTPRPIEVAPGDTILITRSGRAKSQPWFPGIVGRPWHHRLTAGSLHQVKSVGLTGIRLANGIKISRDFGHLAHGYCVTAEDPSRYKIDNLLLLEPSAKDFGDHLCSAVTTARSRTMIFTSAKEPLELAAESHSMAISQQAITRQSLHREQARRATELRSTERER